MLQTQTSYVAITDKQTVIQKDEARLHYRGREKDFAVDTHRHSHRRTEKKQTDSVIGSKESTVFIFPIDLAGLAAVCLLVA